MLCEKLVSAMLAAVVRSELNCVITHFCTLAAVCTPWPVEASVLHPLNDLSTWSTHCKALNWQGPAIHESHARLAHTRCDVTHLG